MRWLVAPDSFKGTLSAGEVAEAIGAGLREAGAEATLMPAADGGEGTMEALLAALGGELVSAPAHDPLGRPIEASYARLADGDTAVVEVARASGLSLVAERERDAEAASTAGTGELVAAAAAGGSRRVLVAAGGSATTDGGAGAIEAIEAAGGLGKAKLEVLCDVSIPFERAAEVFAPQKGADPAAVARLTARLVARAGALPRDPRGRAMTGAAGGLSGRPVGGVRRAPGPRRGLRARPARLRPLAGGGGRGGHRRGATRLAEPGGEARGRGRPALPGRRGAAARDRRQRRAGRALRRALGTGFGDAGRDR